VLGPRGVVAGMAALRERGLAGAFGCCAYGGETAALDRVIASDAFDAMLVHYSMLNQTAFLPSPPGSTVHDYGGVAARAAARGMGIVILRVLEAGLLAENSRERAGAARDDKTARTRALAAVRDGEPNLASAAVRFALSNPAVSTVLIGVSDVSHVDAAVDAAERGRLPAAALEQIERARRADFAA
jgi:aryl-alcohol dehydrogenase-like predicted oxidoreductase